MRSSIVPSNAANISSRTKRSNREAWWSCHSRPLWWRLRRLNLHQISKTELYSNAPPRCFASIASIENHQCSFCAPCSFHCHIRHYKCLPPRAPQRRRRCSEHLCAGFRVDICPHSSIPAKVLEIMIGESKKRAITALTRKTHHLCMPPMRAPPDICWGTRC